jgi:hypothetical protein
VLPRIPLLLLADENIAVPDPNNAVVVKKSRKPRQIGMLRIAVQDFEN